MPRRSSRTTAKAEPAGERRMTRGAVQEVKPNSAEGKKQSHSRTGSHSPSASSTSSTSSSRRAQSASRGRGGRGRSRGRSGQGKKAEEPEEEVEEMEEEASDPEDKAESESTEDQPEAGDAAEETKAAKKATPAKSPRRGRPKAASGTPKKAATPKKEPKASGETPEKEGTRRSSRARSSPRSQQPEPERRRSSRATTKASAVTPDDDEDGDEKDEEMEVEGEDQKKASPKKRKREDEDADETEKSPKKPALDTEQGETEEEKAEDMTEGASPSKEKTEASTEEKAPEEKTEDVEPKDKEADEAKEEESEAKEEESEAKTASPSKKKEQKETKEPEKDSVPDSAAPASGEEKPDGVQVDEVESSDAPAPEAAGPDTPPAEKPVEEEDASAAPATQDDDTAMEDASADQSQAEPSSQPGIDDDTAMEDASTDQSQAEPSSSTSPGKSQAVQAVSSMASSSSSPEKSQPVQVMSTPPAECAPSAEPTAASDEAIEASKQEESDEPKEEAMEVDATSQQNEAVSSSEDVRETPAAASTPAEAAQTPTENQIPAAAKNADDVDALQAVVEPTPEPSPRNDEDAAAQEPAEPEDFVIVSKEELPAADSAEVQDSVPSHTAADSSADPDHMTASAQLDGQSALTPLASMNGCDTDNFNSEHSPVSNAQISQSHQPILNNTDNHVSGPLAGRTYTPNPKIDSSAISSTKQFSLVSYNILADCHVKRWRSDYPFAADEVLSQETRHKLMMQEFAELDADVLCLQEVGTQYYTNTLSPALKLQGYEGSFIRRVGEDFDEGSATFVKSSRFTLLDYNGLVLQDIASKDMKDSGVEEAVQPAVEIAIASPAVTLLAQLRCVHTGATVSIANIHVAFDNFERPDQKSIQVATAIRELVSAAGGADKPHIICGDFNSTSDSPIYQLTSEGYLNDTSMATLQNVTTVTQPDGQKSSLVNLWWKGFQHTSNNLRSAYATVFGSEPISSKFPHDGGLRAVDYIWYGSSCLRLMGVLEAPQASSLQTGVPSTSYPSDHISMKANLAFL